MCNWLRASSSSVSSRSCLSSSLCGPRPRSEKMADSSKSSENHRTDEAENPETKEEVGKEKTVLVASEPMREELVQSAVSFLKHPKVMTSSDVQRRSFLEKKGLTVDEIDEAFRRLASPSSNAARSANTVPNQGILDNSCGIPQQEKENGRNSMDDSGRLKSATESVEPLMPRHPKSYMEIIEMIQRGEKPDDIQEINDKPPNPHQPLSKSRIAPRPKPWEKQGQQNISWDMKSQSSDSKDLRLEVQDNNSNLRTGSTDRSNQGEVLPQAPVVVVSEVPVAAATNFEEATTKANDDGVEQKEKVSQPVVGQACSSTAALDCSPPEE